MQINITNTPTKEEKLEIVEWLKANTSEMRMDGGELFLYVSRKDGWITLNEPTVFELFAAVIDVAIIND